VNKFIGDSIMAFWGAPDARPMDSLEAVKAAILMQRHLYFLNQDLVDEGQAPLHMGIGIHTGNAVVGNVGSLERKEYSALGDTVNTASRIQALTKLDLPISEASYRIFLSEEVYGEVSGSIRAEPLPPQKVKGKTQALNIFSVEGVLEAALEEEKRRNLTFSYQGTIRGGTAPGELTFTGAASGLSRVGLSGTVSEELAVGQEVFVELDLARGGSLTDVPARVMKSGGAAPGGGHMLELRFKPLPSSKLRQLEDFMDLLERSARPPVERS